MDSPLPVPQQCFPHLHATTMAPRPVDCRLKDVRRKFHVFGYPNRSRLESHALGRTHNGAITWTESCILTAARELRKAVAGVGSTSGCGYPGNLTLGSRHHAARAAVAPPMCIRNPFWWRDHCCRLSMARADPARTHPGESPSLPTVVVRRTSSWEIVSNCSRAAEHSLSLRS